MSRPVNLLPWRQSRRLRVLRFWGLMFGALPLLAVALHASQQIARMHIEALGAVRTQADAALGQALAGREAQLKARLAGQALLRQRQTRLRQTAEWETALTNIALRLPENAWLTALSWRDGALTLSGLTGRLATLSELDAALRALPAWHEVTSGATRREGRERWQFSYRLTRPDHEPESD